MDRTSFMKAISSRLYPRLRADGFRGSGTTLRRIAEPLVHVFNVQGSSGGTTCYLNLGVHLTFLPQPGGDETVAKSLKEYECVFRDRWDPPAGSEFGWSYGVTESDMEETIAFLCDHWSTQGSVFFDEYANYPDDFVSRVDEVDPSSVRPIELMTLAQIAGHLGKTDRSETFAREALRRCPEKATILRSEIEQFLGT